MKILNIKPKKYLEQRMRYCGRYTIKAIPSAYNLDDGRDAKKYLPLTQRLFLKSFGMTTPYVINKILSKYGIYARIKIAKNLSDNNKLKAIKKEIDKNHPVILLIGNGYSKNGKYFQLGQKLISHWISIWGYNNKEKIFYVYNSYTHKKDNIPIGNVKRTYSQVLRDWKGAFYTKSYLYISIYKK